MGELESEPVEAVAGEGEEKPRRRGVLFWTIVCLGVLVNYVLVFPFPIMWYFESDFYDTSPLWLDDLVEWTVIPLEIMAEFEPYGAYLDWAYAIVEAVVS